MRAACFREDCAHIRSYTEAIARRNYRPQYPRSHHSKGREGRPPATLGDVTADSRIKGLSDQAAGQKDSGTSGEVNPSSALLSQCMPFKCQGSERVAQVRVEPSDCRTYI